MRRVRGCGNPAKDGATQALTSQIGLERENGNAAAEIRDLRGSDRCLGGHRARLCLSPLLHEVGAQHGLQGKRWPTFDSLAVVRGNQCFQVSPRDNLFHLVEKGLLAGFLGQKIEVQRGLFHATYFIANVWFCQHKSGGLLQNFLKNADSSDAK